MTQNVLILDDIAPPAQAAVEQAAASLREHLTPDLQSITVVGSAATEDYQPGVSDVNTVLVLQQLTRRQLETLSNLAKSLHKLHLAPPVLMTVQYIERSRDVFAVELLDFQLFGVTVWGENPFVDLTFVKSDVRLQCERELKAMLIRLRQGYMASAGNTRMLRDLLVATGKSLLPYLRAMVWLMDGTREPLLRKTLDQAGQTLAVDTSVLNRLNQWRDGKMKVPGEALIAGFDDAYDVILKLTDWVDSHEV